MNTDIGARYNPQAFYSEITASVTHELNNILGIIEQVAGLVEDLTVTTSEGETPMDNRMGEIAEKIIRQTDRGMKLVKRLNKFAHMGDVLSGECDLCDVVENLVALAQRFARLKGKSLRPEIPDDAVMVVINQVRFSEALFTCIKRVVALADAGATVTIKLVDSEYHASILISAPCAEHDPDISKQFQLPENLAQIVVRESESEGSIAVELIVNHTMG